MLLIGTIMKEIQALVLRKLECEYQAKPQEAVFFDTRYLSKSKNSVVVFDNLLQMEIEATS